MFSKTIKRPEITLSQSNFNKTKSNPYFLEKTLASGSASAIPFFKASCRSPICLSKVCGGQLVKMYSKNSQQLLRISLLLELTAFDVKIGINRELWEPWIINRMVTVPAVAITWKKFTKWYYIILIEQIGYFEVEKIETIFFCRTLLFEEN